MSKTFEEEMKNLAVRWAEGPGGHSEDLLEEIFDSLTEFFPSWYPESKSAQTYINYHRK